MRDIVVTLLILGSIPAIFKRPYIGILVFSWISYMNPHRLGWGFSYNMPFAAIIGGLTVILIPFTKEKEKIPLMPLTFVWFMWIFWMNITSLSSLVSEEAFGFEWNRAMKIQLMAILSISLLQDKNKIIYLIWVIILSVGFYSVKGGIFTVLTGGNHIVWGPPGSYFFGNNGLAIVILMTLPLMRFLQSLMEQKRAKYAFTLAMILSLFSVLASYSRGAFLAMSTIGLKFILKSKHKFSYFLLLLILLAAGLSFMPEKYLARLQTIETYEQDGSALGRINAWHFAYNVAKDHPITGGGFGVFNPVLFYIYAPNPSDFHDSHSIYFEVLGEHGFVGLGLFLALGWLAFNQSKKIRMLTSNIKSLEWAHNLASMIHYSLIAYAVGGSFLGLAYFDLYYHLISILVLTRIEVEKVITIEKIIKTDQQK